MLPSKKRLSRTLFTTFAASSEQKVVFNRLGTLKYLPGEARSSVVTSSKHEKLAVKRNLLRRRIYSLLEGANLPYTLVLYVSKQSYGMEYTEIKTLFHDLIQKTTKNS